MGGLKNLLMDRIPQFRIENGVMECDEPLTFKLGEFCTIREDAGTDRFTADDVGDKTYAFYFSRTNMVVASSGVTREYDYKDFGEGVIDNSTLVSLLPIFRISMGLSLVLIYGTDLIRYLFMAGFYSLLCMGMVKDPGGDRLPLRTTFSIAVYAKTLFALISSVGNALGYPMNNVFIELLMVTLTILYIFRGQASVLKIDLKR